MLTDIQFTVSLIFVAIVALYIHRTLKGDYTIVKSGGMKTRYIKSVVP